MNNLLIKKIKDKSAHKKAGCFGLVGCCNGVN
jgi:hypothetical protein